MKSSGNDAGKVTKKQQGYHNASISKYFITSDTTKRKRPSSSPAPLESNSSPATKKSRKTTQESKDTAGLKPGPSHSDEYPLEASNDPEPPDSVSASLEPHIPTYLKKIHLSSKTPFQKRVLTALCQVPCGHYTTYGAMARYLQSSPRAVGNALRENPFAPQVPCHRVLATGGGLGGFMGAWGRKGEEGKNDHKKLTLLRDEGVMFDGRGKVVGGVWEAFV